MRYTAGTQFAYAYFKYILYGLPVAFEDWVLGVEEAAPKLNMGVFVVVTTTACDLSSVFPNVKEEAADGALVVTSGVVLAPNENKFEVTDGVATALAAVTDGGATIVLMEAFVVVAVTLFWFPNPNENPAVDGAEKLNPADGGTADTGFGAVDSVELALL